MSTIAWHDEERCDVGRRPSWSRAASWRQVGLAAAGLLTGLVLVGVLVSSNDPAVHGGSVLVQAVLQVWAFVAAGIVALRRRSYGRLGSLMVAIGLLSATPFLAFSNAPLVSTVGLATFYVWAAALGHMLLAFPDGCVKRRAERLVVAAAYGTAVGAQLLRLSVADSSQLSCAPGCGRNLLLIVPDTELANAVGRVQFVASLALAGAVGVVLLARWRAASVPRRRGLAPVLWCGVVTVVVVAELALASGGVGIWGTAAEWVLTVALASVPFAFLVGLARSSLYQAGAITQLVERLERLPDPGQLAAVLGAALRDPTLRVAYWLPQSARFVDADGHPVELPSDGSGRAVTVVHNDRAPVAAVIHDASLAEDGELIRAVTAPAAVWLDNTRLQAELRARIEAIRESRARVVHAGDTERRRIERDLHDGAQQRLAALLLTVKLARHDRAAQPASTAKLLDGVESELAAALAELRALAAGILPPVLTDRGLAAALRELAGRCPMPVAIEQVLPKRLPAALEVAAYFVVAEAVANTIKHAHADRVRVHVSQANRRVVVEVRDDGVGGANADHGTGLRGLDDRVGALDGHLSVDSPPGRGTTVRAELPCAS